MTPENDSDAHRTSVCPACGFPRGADARYCPRCGRPTLRHVKAQRARFEEESATHNRAIGAVAAVYAGTLAIVIATDLALGPRVDPTVDAGVTHGLFALCGLAGVGILGRNSWRETLGARTGLRGALLGLGGGLALFAVGFAYVWLLDRLVPGSGAVGIDIPFPLLVLGAAILPALVEEWLDRGVLWTACRRITSVRMTLLLTALLFALSHGIAWGQLGIPHRFVYGLILGWLRHRTGSLIPGILAHFVVNFLSITLA